MISLLASLLGGRTWLAWVIVAGAAFAGLGGAYAYIDHRGYERATLEWTVKYQRRETELAQQRADELDRQAAVNAQAKAHEQQALVEMESQLAASQALVDELAREAAQDPNANKLGIDADAVDRLNRIQ